MTEFGKRLDGPGGRRTAARGPVVLTAALLTVGCSRPIIILDLSSAGAQIRVNEPMHPGQEVWIKSAPVEVFGTVIWAEGDHCGIAFDEPLDESSLALLLDKGRITPNRSLTPDEQLAIDDWNGGLAR